MKTKKNIAFHVLCLLSMNTLNYNVDMYIYMVMFENTYLK